MNEDNKNMDTLINNCSNNTTSQQPIQPQINLLTRHHSQTQLLKRDSSPLSSSSSNSNISATELINNNNNNNNNNSNSNNSTNLLNTKPTEWPALDEFIIELLSKPAERLFLLKLEQDLIQFVKNHQMYRLDLPGMNSYQRLMIHKVAPYFNLSHFYDPARQAIFLCKNPYTDVPPISFSDTVKPENGEQSGQNAFKIMRRTPLNNKHHHRHSNHHQNNSDSNSDSSDQRKKMLTYEERKTAYEIARARIFNDLEQKQQPSST